MTRPHLMGWAHRLIAPTNLPGDAVTQHDTSDAPAPVSPNAGGSADGGGPDCTSSVGPIPRLTSPNGHDIQPSRQVGDGIGITSKPPCTCDGHMKLAGRHAEACPLVAAVDAFDALIARAAARLTEGAA